MDHSNAGAPPKETLIALAKHGCTIQYRDKDTIVVGTKDQAFTINIRDYDDRMFMFYLKHLNQSLDEYYASEE